MTKAITGHQLIYVADSSNIEARMLAWEAGHEPLLEQFQAKQDVYSNFASEIYGFPVNKHDHKTERFVGKTCLARGTLVLTDTGWKPIEAVSTQDKVWDGESWVDHQGVIYNGCKPTLKLYDLSLTPDHLVWSGTEWRDASSLERDVNILSRALAHAAENLPSQAISGALEVGSRHSSSNAIADSLNTQSTPTTSNTSNQHGVISAPKKQAEKNAIGNTRRHYQTTYTAHDYSTAWQRLSHAATRLLPGCISTMAGGVFASTKNGLTTALRSFGMSRLSRGGTTLNMKWIGSTTTGTTNLATYGLSPAVSIPVTGDKSATFRMKSHVYDVTCAGPKNRFTVWAGKGPLIVHNCVLGLGYGTGWSKLKDSLATSETPVYLDEAEARRIVNLYRTVNAPIKQYWQQANQAIIDMYLGNSRQWGPLTIHRNCLVMPNGMALQYPGLRPTDPSEDGTLPGGWEYWEGKFWTRLYGAKLVENLTQALARIVLFEQMLKINKLFEPLDGRVVLNVHDEIVAVGPSFGARFHGLDDQGDEVWSQTDEAQALFDQMLDIMRTQPTWCPDLPLDGEGGFSFQYVK